MVFRVDGHLDVDMLTDRLCILAARHQALRVAWPDLADIGSPERVADEVLDVWDTHDGDVRSFAMAMALAGYRRPSVPLWLVRLVRTTRSGEHLLVGLDRAISDPWSLHVLAQELSQLCGAGPVPELGPAPAQFAAILADRAALADHPDGLAERAYWRRQVSEVDFGADPCVVRAEPVPARARSIPLDAEGARILVTLASAHHTTMLAVVAAAVHQVWRRWVGVPETVLLTEVGYRDDPALDGAVAPVMEPRPVRIVGCPGEEFGALVDRVRDVLLDVLDNTSVPLAVDPTPLRPFTSRPDRMTVQVEFDTANDPTAPGSMLALLDEIDYWSAGRPRADLHVMVRGDRGAPALYLVQNPLAVSEAAAAEFAEGVSNALRGM